MRLVFILAALTACGDTATEVPSSDGVPVEVSFQARVGDSPFLCGGSFDGIGTTASTLAPTDLRFYIHDVVLLDDSGTEVAIALDQDGEWQHENLVLLDFEDGCSAGTTSQNTTVRGSAAAGEFSGVRFVFGVPFGLNHIDARSAPPPLNEEAMFWSWNQGYKFIRIDASTTGLGEDGYHVHIGSTGCEGDGAGTVTGCSEENRSSVSVSGIDPLRDPVIFDLGALLQETNVDFNTERTAPGCFGESEDPDCDAILARLGVSGDGQSVFRGQ
jgi:uncharacterized repeat protein (TIGR04052 family)